MKKVSTAAAKQGGSFSRQPLTIGLDVGDRAVVLRVGRSRPDTTGAARGHDGQGTAQSLQGHAALSHRAGDRDAFAMGEPVAERGWAEGRLIAALASPLRVLFFELPTQTMPADEFHGTADGVVIVEPLPSNRPTRRFSIIPILKNDVARS